MSAPLRNEAKIVLLEATDILQALDLADPRHHRNHKMLRQARVFYRAGDFRQAHATCHKIIETCTPSPINEQAPIESSVQALPVKQPISQVTSSPPPSKAEEVISSIEDVFSFVEEDVEEKTDTSPQNVITHIVQETEPALVEPPKQQDTHAIEQSLAAFEARMRTMESATNQVASTLNLLHKQLLEIKASSAKTESTPALSALETMIQSVQEELHIADFSQNTGEINQRLEQVEAAIHQTLEKIKTLPKGEQKDVRQDTDDIIKAIQQIPIPPLPDISSVDTHLGAIQEAVGKNSLQTTHVVEKISELLAHIVGLDNTSEQDRLGKHEIAQLLKDHQPTVDLSNISDNLTTLNTGITDYEARVGQMQETLIGIKDGLGVGLKEHLGLDMDKLTNVVKDAIQPSTKSIAEMSKVIMAVSAVLKEIDQRLKNMEGHTSPVSFDKEEMASLFAGFKDEHLPEIAKLSQSVTALETHLSNMDEQLISVHEQNEQVVTQLRALTERPATEETSQSLEATSVSDKLTTLEVKLQGLENILSDVRMRLTPSNMGQDSSDTNQQDTAECQFDTKPIPGPDQEADDSNPSIYKEGVINDELDALFDDLEG